ncbi:phosphorothioated DNA-binding restriction endonuclease [Bacillus sp. V33-4]|uniref:phosphorothioated DNA-binding restriction endonuclease n=1 Tax=Bacillus sp. V33-4 TaxID=2054169 RepID=UPI000C775D2F|nr:HNH endonuclease [Bacillus sp. V33-4]PLR87855.1 restriction endonuclease [Bacillus sp. V33-4]
MDQINLLKKVKNLSIWKNGSQRAPHKPLLILYALGKMKEDIQFLPYEEVRKDLIQLLLEFGPSRKSYHPEQPFVRLKNDGLWRLSQPIDSTNFNRDLLANHVSGGFTDDVYKLLKSNKVLQKEVAFQLLNDHFPTTLHDDILQAVGLGYDFPIQENSNNIECYKRAPDFRLKILKAYEYQCAVCGFNVRVGHVPVGLEAAHIKWHQAGGPAIEENGLCLCILHHKLFDRGAFTILEDRKLIVSEETYGTNGFNEWLMRFHGKEIRKPISPNYYPDHTYIHWHVKEVFRGTGRYLEDD